jgi:energy-coupling factor transport system permease protein
MGKRSLLGRSIPGTSFIHRLDARVKFIAAILLMIATLSSKSPIVLAVISLWAMVLVALSHIRVRIVLRSVRPIIFLIIFAMVIHFFTVRGTPLFRVGSIVISLEGLTSGLLTALRISLMVIQTSLLLTLTTTPIAIADAMERLLLPLKHLHFPVQEFSMMMSIAMRFVPTLLDEAMRLMKAQSSRGADFDTGGLMRRARGLVSILVPLFVSSFRRADDLAVAMEARCYGGTSSRTTLYAMKLQRRDYLFLTAAVLISAFVFLWQG